MEKRLLKFLSILLLISFLITHGAVGIVRAEDDSDNTVAEHTHIDHELDPESEVSPDGPNFTGNGSSNALGYVEPDIDLDTLLHKSSPSQNRGTLPASYSLVSKGYVTSVKNQNPYGTCWTFATVGSAESSLKKKYGETVDLAELQLAYFFYNCYKKPDPMQLITNDGNYSDDYYILDIGGNSFDTTFALASGIGFTDESAYPYTDAESFLANGTTKACYNTTYRLRSSRWLNMSEPEKVKQALMNYGALAVSYYHYDYYLNESTYAYYQNESSYSNHAVTLVGWDDNFSRDNFYSGNRPSGNGAWLVKNSWGTWWGNDGYFWISYEDPSLQESEAVFFETEMGSDVPKEYYLYQYDGGGVYSWSTLYTDNAYMANIYEAASNDEFLTDVGFVAGQADTQYTIYIYKNVTDDDPTSGELALTQNGLLSDAGYYLIELDSQVRLSRGEKYSVVIRQSSASDTVQIYLDQNSTSFGVYMYNDVTNDISYYSYDGSYWRSLTSNGQTARIKAVTVKTNNAPTETTARNYGAGILVEWDRVPGASGYVVYRRAMLPGETAWTTFARWNNTKELSFFDTKVYEGTKYQYGIKVYYGEDPTTTTRLGPVGPMSTALIYRKKPDATTKTTVENTADGIVLKWNAVKGAGGYIIYRRAWSSSTNGWTDFKRWNNTTSTEWTDTNVYAGTRYQYGIKAYYGNDPKNMAYVGEVGPLKATVRITTRRILDYYEVRDEYNRPQKVYFEWEPSGLFTGYQIDLQIIDYYRNVSSKQFTINNKSVKSYTIEDASYGNCYIFKIRSYHVLNGITYYGGWSEEIKFQF